MTRIRVPILLALSLAWLTVAMAVLADSSDALLARLRPQGYVSDFAGVLSEDESKMLDDFLRDLAEKTGSQVAVVTVQSIEGGDIDDFTTRLTENKKWQIGKKGKDSGVLIFAAIQDHKARIAVGYGLESVLPDAEAGRILREQMFPQFKQGRYGAGLMQAAQEVATAIAHNAGVTLTNVPRQRSSVNHDRYQVYVVYVVFALWIVLWIVFMPKGRGRRGGGYGYWYGGSGFGGGSSGSGFSGGGGFGGFGGGSFGGGGASGSW